ncbi:glycosyltransferase family 39 protein [Aphanothece sacrum]|uniref:Glycosyl transferase n=1 Tax=Aphanothece sacrum FPU1 TaxID=1920663 RepID=A0A401IM17_APHSA|nr:glycosyltransferase family 39 protein [Aphanothece sacrum]GBF82285.1 glycosyl transferase [Aphanothece sacrum FPU1]GBF84186.1 glycosyl transferase [Aphanothece sacrum FPU3]
MGQDQAENGHLKLLIIILIIAALLRLIFLDKVPNGFFPDEASYAYDAYSILHTLRDQYGKFLPFMFKSANDYREGLYIYLLIPFIKILGLNVFGIRVASAFIGTLTVLIVYHLSKECFNKRVGLFSALLLAISPWHIQFSRIGFRAILFPCLFCLSLLVFVKSIKQLKYLPLSSFLFAISIFTYQSARVFVPLFLIGLVIIFYQHLWQNKRYTLISIIVFLCFFVPQLIYYLSPEGMTRANDVMIAPDFLTFSNYYFAHFSPDFMFFKGDPNPRHLPQNRGEIYYFDMVTLTIGLIYLIKEKRKESAIFMLWLLLYPIPAALTSEIHSLRAMIGAPLMAIISGYGITKLIDLFPQKQKIINGIILFVISISLVFFCHRYFIDYPRWRTDAWLSTMGEVITYANNTSAECIIIDSNVYGKHIYILVPFYTKLDPSDYQKLNVDVAINKLDMGRWKVIDLSKDASLNETCLYIVSTQEFSRLRDRGYHAKSVHHFKDINGEELYQLVKVKKIASTEPSM